MKKSLLPLLIISFLIVSGFAIYNEQPPKVQNQVLSEEVENRVGTPDPTETPKPEEEFERETERTVKEGTVSSKIKIRINKNKFEFEEEGEKTRVRTNFPLSVNPTTRELTVSTPSGTRVVAVLPERAINNMIEAGFVTTAKDAELTTGKDGSLVYEIDGTKEERLLWLFKITLRRRISVSAETGEVVALDQSTLNRLLDFLSI